MNFSNSNLKCKFYGINRIFGTFNSNRHCTTIVSRLLIETTSKYDINRKKYVSKWTIQNLKSQDNNEFVFT